MILIFAAIAALQAPVAAPVPVSDAQPIAGRIANSDYPSAEARAGTGGTTAVRTLIGESGRVSACVVTQSSGSAVLDGTVCRIFQSRFRFRPARDAAGRPIPQWLVTRWSWRPPRSIALDPAFEPERPR